MRRMRFIGVPFALTVDCGRLHTRRARPCETVSFRFQNGIERRRAVEFRILGPLEVEGPDGPIQLGGRKQRALLALLLLHANEVVPTGRLIELLWDDAPPADAAKALQVNVSRLRSTLAPDDALETRPGGYLLAVERSTFDLARFEEQTAAGRELLAAGDVPAARESFAAALDKWRGTPFADLAAEPFALAEIA